jgi:hypothetical protein
MFIVTPSTSHHPRFSDAAYGGDIVSTALMMGLAVVFASVMALPSNGIDGDVELHESTSLGSDMIAEDDETMVVAGGDARGWDGAVGSTTFAIEVKVQCCQVWSPSHMNGTFVSL